MSNPQPVEKLLKEAEEHQPPETLAKALVKAQGMMGHAAQSGKNKFLKDDDGNVGRPYSTLANVIDAVKPALTSCGIGYTQKVRQKAQMVQVKTVFIHVSGEKMDNGWLSVPAEKPTAHGYGTALTYAKRYSLAAACGISADPDSDGNPEDAKRTGVMAAMIEEGGLDIDEARVQEWVEYLDSDVFTIEGEGRSAKVECVVPEAKFQEILRRLNNAGADNKIAILDRMGSKVKAYINSVEKS